MQNKLMFEGLQTRDIHYEHDGKKLMGYLCAPVNAAQLPGVFIVHTWLGLDEGIKKRAQAIAALGYSTFVVDLFARHLPEPPIQSLAAIKPFLEDRVMFRDSLEAGLAAFRTQPECCGQIAAIGYCFGGCAVLELARGGADVRGVVSFHGELDSPMRAKTGDIKARILVLHGDADIVVKKETIEPFLQEMRNSGATWELDIYSDAKHSFTGEGAHGKNTPEAGMNQIAEGRSWNRMKDFFVEVFAPPESEKQ